MQARVARAVGPVITVSESAKADICRDFRVPADRVHIIPLGVDTRVFRPRDVPGGSGGTVLPSKGRVPGRAVAVTSADSALKGTATLLRAVGKLVTERDVHLVVVGKPGPDTIRLVAELSLRDRVRFTHGLDDTAYSELLASAEIAVVPSLYEGFSLPAVEHMASGTALVASRAGALPEVTGDAAVLVPPGDAEELCAALLRLHDSPAERAALGERALRRVSERFSWAAVARATAERYREAIAPGAGAGSGSGAGAGIATETGIATGTGAAAC
jgi:glycosyltransferase involved in cell wall biosynthesis